MVRKNLIIGLLLALVTLLIDQGSKWWLMKLIGESGPVVDLCAYFNLVLVWNPGISFGMLGGSAYAPMIFTVLACAIGIVLIAWLRKVEQWPLAVAIGLVLGGAAGNVVDRQRFGAVADFFDAHIGVYHWPAFNVADSAIFLGVVIMAWDALHSAPKRESNHEP